MWTTVESTYWDVPCQHSGTGVQTGKMAAEQKHRQVGALRGNGANAQQCAGSMVQKGKRTDYNSASCALPEAGVPQLPSACAASASGTTASSIAP